jgi:hypothetical protein
MELSVSVSESKGAVVLDVFVQPRAARDAIAGEYRGALKIKTTSPPVEGKANEAVERLVAEWLDRPKSDVKVISGSKSRAKRVAIRGITLKRVQDALQLVLSSRPHEPG